MSDYVQRILRLVGSRELSTANAKSLITDYLRETEQTLNVRAAETDAGDSGRHDIAVVGMSGRFPGAADVHEFWGNLRAGACAVTEVPRERWDVSAYYDPHGAPGKSPCKWGGFLPGVDLFDPLFFSISGSEAELTDPQQRVFLEEAWKALEDAAYADWWLSERRCGVFVGVGAGDYTHEMIARHLPPDPYAFLGNSISVLASRISYLLNLKGPSLAVDTACSSSLVAVHLACQSLISGESELALAGGVFLSATSAFHYLTGRLGMLSPTGRCYAFDDAADGFVPGEAAGVVVLRPLEDARRDGDHVYAVIRASGVNQDGRTNGITAPSSISQSDLEAEVYRKAGISPESIGYVEAHGTGTRLGDPIEIEALTRAFRRHTDRRGFCAVGSAKTNVGHAGAAAGIVGLIKTLLSLRHRQLPPSLNFQTPNRHLRLSESPFYVNTTLRDWHAEEGRPRRAAVSAFGLSGVNAHVVLEEPPPPVVSPDHTARAREQAPSYQLVTVSARTEDSFAARLAELERWLVAEGAQHSLSDIAYTLNYGRSHFELRAAFVVADREELVERLRSLRQQGEAADCRTSAQEGRDRAEPASEKELRILAEELGSAAVDGDGVRTRLLKLAAAYARREEIDWRLLYAGGGRRRVPLPTYPFSRERYWLPEGTPSSARHEEASTHFFSRVWRPSGRRPAVPSSAPLRVMVVGGGEEFVGELRRSLPDGASVSWQARYRAPDYEELLSTPGGRERERAAVLFIRDAVEAGEHVSPDALTEELKPQLELAARLAEGELGARPRVLSLHWRAGGVREAAHEAEAALAPSLRALGRRPKWQTLKLDPALRDARVVARLVAEELGHDASDEDEILYDAEQQRHTRQSAPVELPGADGAPPIRRQGVYLITGGAGALGLLFARHFTRRHGAKVVLTGRSEMSEKLRAVLGELGDGVDYVVADAASPAEMRRAVEFTREKHGALHGVVHAAGVIAPELVRQKTAEQCARVLRPKVAGALVLDEVTKDERLDFFVLFSSLSAVVGDFGQCDYALANRFLDGFAAWRASRVQAGAGRGRTLSINWPLWKCGGMNFAAGEQAAYASATGLDWLETESGLDAFERALASGLTQVVVASGERRRVEQLLGVVSSEPPADAPGAQDGQGRGTGGEQSRIAEPCERGVARAEADAPLLRAVQEEVRAMLARILKVRADKLGFDAGFGSFGLESINMKGFADLLGGRYGVNLSPTLFFEHNSIAALAQYLLREHPGLFLVRDRQHAEAGHAPSSTASTLAAHATSVSNPGAVGDRERARANGDEGVETGDGLIAIVGASGRFPQSKNLEEFWQHLVAGRDLITEIPPERWDWREYHAASESDKAKSVSRWGGFMPELDRFDAAFFQISPREAAFTDPQHRVFLETVWHTIEDAGYRPSALAGRRVGLFVGCQFNEYMGLIGDGGEARAQAALGNTHTMLANRVSYLLDLRGPSEAVDTACSSALVALHRAASSILSGECELAIAGGVSAILSPETYVLSTQLGMLSPDGRCKTFDRSANGYVKGEGVGAVLLKRLSRAVADGDHVYAVVRATAVNHGGKANSLTAPNPDAQAGLIREALRRARISPASLSYIEAHGTGTELGDPIEVDALRRAFAEQSAERGESLPAGQFCGIGSVKSNIGHLEPAAGIAGLLKVLLALRHRRLPASLHVEHVNPYLRLEGSPFYIVREARDWTAGTDERGRPVPRRAGVSSFGFGGSNAHVLLEEFVAAAASDVGGRAEAAAPARNVVPLSAKNEERLREYARLVAEFLEQSPAVARADFWPDFVFTMQEGREAFDARAAFVADSADDLVQKLRAWLAAGDARDSYTGNARRAAPAASIFDTREEWDEFLRATVSKGRLDKLARLWAEGADVDWALLGGRQGRRRIPLPTYPFARTRYWFDSVARPRPPVAEKTRETTRQASLPAQEAIEETALHAASPGQLSEETSSGGNRPGGQESAAENVAAPPPEVAAQIQERVTQMLAASLYMDASDIDASVSFSEMGLDSILAVQLVKEINQEFGTNLKATRLYDYPSVETLSAFLAGRLTSAGRAPDAGEDIARGEDTPPSPADGRGLSFDFATTQPENVTPDAFSDDAPDSFVAAGAPRRAAGELSVAEVGARLKELLAETLYLDVSDVDEETKFVDLGLDSILAVELVKQINEAYGTNFKATRLYDYSSVRELSDYIARHVGEGATPTDGGVPAEQPTGTPAGASTATPAEPTPTQSAAQTPAAASHLTAVEQNLRRRLAEKLLVQESDLDDHLDLLELGFDLVAAGSLAREINQEFGTTFEGAQLLRYPNLRRLSQDVLAGIAGRRGREPGHAEETTEGEPGAAVRGETRTPAGTRAPLAEAPPTSARDACDIAVIGMSGRFPGARNLEEYWHNLINGVDSVTEIPPSRWDAELAYDPDPNAPNKSYCRRGGFLGDVDAFDPFFFHLSPRDAEIMDPQQRLFLEEGWRALEDAGYSDAALSNKRCAIFVGAGQGDYFLKFTRGDNHLTGQFGMGNVNSILAARLAYLLNLKGPSVAVDTACSSSLVAVHLACQSIASGESEMALAGGVFVMTTPQTHVLTSQARMLSPEGRCKTFDAGADGFVPGEGVGAVVLKPLASALADGDHVYAVIRGSATNQDGKTNGLTAPSALSQTELQLSVYRSRGLDPSTFTYVEAHGTGTKLGDPIEIDALTESFRRYTGRKRFCAIGSVKTNIGHSLPAAGIAALIKVLLSLKHRQIPPSLHCGRENEHIDFAGSPFFVNVEPRAWTADEGEPRRAAINSFGFSGTNAHLVVEEAPTPAGRPEEAPAAAHLFTLSARTARALRQRVRDLAAWLRRERTLHRLSDIGYTLNVGRSHFAQRLAIIACEAGDLLAQLEWLSGKENVAGVWVSKEAEAKLETSGGLAATAQSYAGGGAVEWAKFYAHVRPRRVPLPTYPFEARHCSMAPPEAGPETPPARADQVGSRPLAETLKSFDGVTFHRRLTRAEPLLRDHLVRGLSLLAGAASLDMALTAAAAVDERFGRASLRQVRWPAPLAVESEGRDVSLRLTAAGGGGAVRFEITAEGAGARVLHAHGELFCEAATAPETHAGHDLASALARCPRELGGEEIYERLGAMGIAYGPTFRNVGWVRCGGEGEAVALLRLSAAEGSLDQHRLHPGLVDAALQSIVALVNGEASRRGRLMMPYGIEQVSVHGRLEPLCYAHVRSVPPPDVGGAAARFDVTLVNEAGRVLVEIKGFEAREAGRRALEAGVAKAATPPSRDGEPSAGEATPQAETEFFAPHWACAPSPPESEHTNDQAERVLIVRPEDDLGLSSLLLKAHEGQAVYEVLLGGRFASLEARRWEINHREPADFRRVCDSLPRFERVYFLGGVGSQSSLEPDEVERSQERSALSLFRLAQALGGAWGGEGRARLTVVTNDVQHVLPTDSIRPHAASAVGLAKVIAREYPHLEVSCVDVSSGDLAAADAGVLEDLSRALAAERGHAAGVEVAFRGRGRFEKRFRRLSLPPVAGEDLPLRRNGVYLVVGGAGGIGGQVCRFLAERAGARVAVVGRSPLDAAKEKLLAELRGAGAAEAVYLRADVTSLEETRAALAELSARWGDINGVVHSAMVLADGTLARMREDGFRAAFDVKVRGVSVLAKALEEFSPDWLVLFSSTISWTANAGQGNYVAASAFEDAFGLRLRQEAKYDVKVLNWGYWGGVGAVAGAKYRERAARLGVGSIDAAEGLDAFARVLAGDSPQVFVLKATRAVLVRLGVDQHAEPRDQPPRTKPFVAQSGSELSVGVAAVADVESPGGVKSYLRAVFSEVLKAGEGEIEEDVDFENYGIDSLVAIDIMQRLEADLGVLPQTLLFEQPTLEKLARHLVANVPAGTLRRLLLRRDGNVNRPHGDGNGNGKSGAAEQAALIVHVKRGGGARASFWVHGALGEISWVVRLARHLSDECPVYALQARGLDGRAEPFESIEEMAAAYVGAIREVAPRGPYVLGGYSLGGAVALEMAHQFERRGEEVSRLILLDAYAPGSRAMQSLITFEDDDFVLLAVTNLLALQWKATALLKAGMLPPGDLRRKTEFAAAHLFANSIQPYGLTDLVAHLRRFVQVAHRHAELLTRYEARPRLSPLATALFRATRGFSAGESALGLPRVEVAGQERDLGWGGLLPSPPEVLDVDADHFSLSVEPAVLSVAQHLSRLFESDASGAAAGGVPEGPRAAQAEALRKKREIFEVIREQVLRVLVDVPSAAVVPEISLRALGANSIDRVEVVTLAMEALDANVPRARLGGVNNLQGLVDVFYEHLSAS